MDKIANFIVGLNTNLLLVLVIAIILSLSIAIGVSFVLLDKKVDSIIEQAIREKDVKNG